MAELGRRIAHAAAFADPAWTAERSARVRAGVSRKLVRSRRRRVALVGVAAAGMLLVGFALGRQQTATAVRQALPETPAAVASLVQLPDGSSVTAVSPDAQVETIAVSPDEVTLRLDAGAARFSVTPNHHRPFHVIARDVSVTVLGTIFSVALDEHEVHVSVERGRVRVDAPHESRVLAVGEAHSFESGAAEPDARRGASEAPAEPAPSRVAVDALPPETAEPAPHPAAAPPAAPSWRALARDQNYTAALARLTAEGPGAVHDTTEDLLLAADVARLGGRPDRAVAPLQRVVADHAFDPRAALAAFTLGRTLLEQLGRPRDAARAFATARRLDRGGALTQDALAREVEAWSGAGDATQARERALEYVKLYPHGRRISAVRRLGGLD